MWVVWCSHSYFKCNSSLNSGLLREILYFLGGARLANSMLLSVTLDFLSVFSLMSNFFKIILAFFESVMFCFSVLMFLFIRVCSVSAISVSLFSNGPQTVRDH